MVRPEDTIALQWSDDNGYKFTEPLVRGLGLAGQNGRRIIFNRLGSFPNTRVLKITYTGTTPVSINKIMANVL